MALGTRNAILNTFAEMLHKMPFSEITVTALVKNCGISPNTFYYHYEDIYALLNDFIGGFVSYFAVGDKDSNYQSTYDSICALLTAFKENEQSVYHIVDSISMNFIARGSLEVGKDAIRSHVLCAAKSIEGEVPQHAIDAIVDYCYYAIVGNIIRFCWQHMNADIESTARQLDVLTTATINESLRAVTNSK